MLALVTGLRSPRPASPSALTCAVLPAGVLQRLLQGLSMRLQLCSWRTCLLYSPGAREVLFTFSLVGCRASIVPLWSLPNHSSPARCCSPGRAGRTSAAPPETQRSEALKDLRLLFATETEFSGPPAALRRSSRKG